MWLMYYNYQRIDGSLGVTPVEKLFEHIYDGPTSDEVDEVYDLAKKHY